MSPVRTQPRKARIAYRMPLKGNWQSWLTPGWELGTFCSEAGSWGDRAVTTAAPTAPLYRITDCTRLSQKHPTTSSIEILFKCKYFERRFCFELNTKFYIHQASIQNKRRTQPIQTKQNSWCPFWIKPALLLACSPFWVYFELSAGETKEDGAVWRIRGAEKNTAENGKERENRISLIFERGEVFKRISEWSIGAIKFGYNNWPWRLLIAKWHHTHKMNENKLSKLKEQVGRQILPREMIWWCWSAQPATCQDSKSGTTQYRTFENWPAWSTPRVLHNHRLTTFVQAISLAREDA